MTATIAATPQTEAIPDDSAGEARPSDGSWPGLAAAAIDAGVPLTDDQLLRFAAYRDLLLARNRQTNLTAVRDPDEVERRLFLDALRLVPALDAATGTPNRAPRTVRLVDVGSGAGFPGLALKIARPDLDVALVEATGKKVAFLEEAIVTLGLDGATAIHARAEEIGHRSEHRGTYDVATARAVAALPALLELCVPLLRTEGLGIFPKGAAIDDEWETAARAAPVLGARLLAAEVLPGGSRLVRALKVTPTPDRYPRRAGLPARQPIGSAAARPQRSRPRPASRRNVAKAGGSPLSREGAGR